MENPPQIADQTDNFSHFDFANLTQADSYKLLVSVVMPRPVAWVPIAASDRTDKDTRYNIRERSELVVHMVRCSPILRASGVRAGRVPTSVWHRAAQQDSERTMAWADLQIIEINFRN